MPSASSKNVRAGGAYVEFFAKDGALDASLRRIGSKLKTFGASASMTGAAVSSVGALAAAPFAMGIRTFADFEQAMSNVRARTNASADEMQKLDALANKLGMTTKFSATEAANAMEVFAKAGFDVNKIMAATGETLNLAATSGVSIAEAADIATNILGGFRMEASDMTRVVDVMSLASNSAKVSVSELGESLKIVGAKGAASGYSVEELSAVFQELGDSGIRGEQAGVAVRGMLLTLTSATGPAREALDKIGFSHKDAAGNVLTLTEMIEQLQRAFEKLPSGERAEAMGKIFTNAQTSGAETLIMSGVDAIRARTQALLAAAGTAERISAVQKDNILGDEELVKSATEGMFITLGKIFAGTYRTSLGFVNFAITKTTEFIDTHHTLARVAAASATALLLVGGALAAIGVSSVAAGMMFNGLNNTVRVTVTVMSAIYRVSRVLSLFNALSAGVGLLSTGMMSMTGATSLATAAYTLLSGVVAFTLSPLGLVVAAVAAAVYWWDDLYSIAINFADQVGAGMEVCGGIIWGVFSSLGEVLAATWRTFTIFITSSEYLMEVWGRAIGLYKLVVSVVSEVGGTLLFVARGLWSATSAVMSFVTSAISSVMEVLGGVAAVVMPYVGEVIDALLWAAGEVASGVFRVVWSWLRPLTAPIRWLYEFVSRNVVALGRRLKEFGSTVLQSVRQWMSAIPGLVSSAWGFISQYVVSIGSAASNIGSDLANWLGSVMSQVSTLFGDLWGIASETFTAIQTAISNGNWEAAGNALWAALKLAWVKGVNTINSIWRAASGEVVETWKGTVDILSSIWAGLIAGIEGKLAAAQNKTASWIIEAQRMAGVLSDEEAKGAQEELALMGKEAQQRIASRKTDAQRELEAEAEKRREAARQADAAAMSESAKSLAQAQSEYDAAMKAAVEAKPAAEGSTAAAGKTSTKNMTKLGETLAPTIAKTGGMGGGITLSAMASRMLAGTDDPAKKTAKHTEKMTDQLQTIIDQNLMAPDPQVMVA